MSKELFKLHRRDFLRMSAAATPGLVVPVGGLIGTSDIEAQAEAPIPSGLAHNAIHDV